MNQYYCNYDIVGFMDKIYNNVINYVIIIYNKQFSRADKSAFSDYIQYIDVKGGMIAL
jgi:hypothetical protein